MRWLWIVGAGYENQDGRLAVDLVIAKGTNLFLGHVTAFAARGKWVARCASW